jgi:hypothetical protein
MTNIDRERNIPRVPIRKCPVCGIRQYAPVSYVADLKCVECGTLLAAARPEPFKLGPAGTRRQASEERVPHALSHASRRRG